MYTLNIAVERVVYFIESNSYSRLFRFLISSIGFFIVILTAYQIIIDIEDRRIQRDGIKSQLISDAWNTLSTNNVINNGKSYALNYLSSVRSPFDGLDISCETLNLGWNSKKFSCERPPFLSGVSIGEYSSLYPESYRTVHRIEESAIDLNNSDDEQISPIRNFDFFVPPDFNNERSILVSIYQVKLSGNAIYNSTFHRVSLNNANFDGANIVRSNFEMSHLNGSFKNTKFINVNLSEATLSGSFLGTTISHANLSATRFMDEIDPAQIDNAWAWADMPPQLSEPLENYDIMLCDPSVRDIIYKSQDEMNTVEQNRISSFYQEQRDLIIGDRDESYFVFFPSAIHINRETGEWIFDCVDSRPERRILSLGRDELGSSGDFFGVEDRDDGEGSNIPSP